MKTDSMRATLTPEMRNGIDCEEAHGGSALYSAAVPDPSVRPLLFLDVDGTLIPFKTPEPRPAAATVPHPLPTGANPLLTRIDRRHGTRLSALPCDLVWATTWMADANEVIGPLLGLPELPVVDWPDSEDEGLLHWKTRGLAGWAAARSSGSTTRSPTPTAPGCPRTTAGRRSFTASTLAWA
jgi:hypothetical protein